MCQERGSALILVLILTVLLSVLGLSLALSSMTDYRMSNEFESRERALLIAEAGLGVIKDALRTTSYDTLLSATIAVPDYISQTAPTPGGYEYRNPIPTLVARTIDFNSPPQPASSSSVTGFFTAAAGTTVGGGRFFARFTDNDDGDGNFTADSDGQVYARVIGVHPNAPDELASHGGRIKNSIAILEVVVSQSSSSPFALDTPFTVVGQDVIPAKNKLFNGNAFFVDGFDHSGMTTAQIQSDSHNHTGETSPFAGIGAVYDNAPTDASNAVTTMTNALTNNQNDNIIGAGGEPSIRDDTDMLRIAGSPATNIFDPNYLAGFVAQVSGSADVTYPTGTHLTGGSQIGTESSPQITVVEGNLTLSGGGSGAGILLVKGRLDFNGAYDFQGLILVVGAGELDVGGANKGVIGGIMVAKLVDDGAGNFSYGTPSFTLSGNSNFWFRSASIEMAVNLLSSSNSSVVWREIFPEIEPDESTP